MRIRLPVGIAAALVLALAGCESPPLRAECIDLAGPPTVHVGLNGGQAPADMFMPAIDGATYEVACDPCGDFTIWASVDIENLQPTGLDVQFNVTHNGDTVVGRRAKIDVGSGQESRLRIFPSGDPYTVSPNDISYSCTPPDGDIVIETVVTDNCGQTASETHTIQLVDRACFPCRGP